MTEGMKSYVGGWRGETVKEGEMEENVTVGKVQPMKDPFRCAKSPSISSQLFFDFLFRFERERRAVLFTLLQNEWNCELHFTIYVAISCHFEVLLEFPQL